MMIFTKRILYILLVFVIFVATPIYATYRLVTPDLLLNKLSQNLPKGVNISVENVVSKANLEIIYENVRVTSNNNSLIIDKLMVKPVLDLKKPIFMLADEIIFDSARLKIIANKIETSILLTNFDIDNLRLKGKFDQLKSPEEAIIFHGDFLLAGINSPLKQLDLTAEKIEFASETPQGLLEFKLIESNHSYAVGSNLVGKTLAEGINLNFFPFGTNVRTQNFSGKKVDLGIELVNQENSAGWKVPIEISAESVKSNETFLFQRVELKATGQWTGQGDIRCDLSNIIKAEEHCGKITDVIGADVLVRNNKEMIRFYGDGYCVAPESGCRQIIKARLVSKETQSAFLRLLDTEVINPVILSVLMGVLISSPFESNDFDHKVDVSVNGSEILFNKKALF